MSSLYSAGRRSVDSELSITSSHTVFSHTLRPDHSHEQGSSLSDLAQDRDAGRQRAKRVQSSGRFLLDSQFTRSPRHTRRLRRQAHNGSEEIERRPSLGNPLLPGQPQVEGLDHEIRIDKTRAGAPSAQHAIYDRDRGSSFEPRLQQPIIDPNQLVHMALNLSESRRRNVSAGQLLATQLRTASGTQRGGSLGYSSGNSLRNHFNEQRRAPINISPLGGSKAPPGRNMSMSVQGGSSIGFPASQSNPPSSATLARVDKVRISIELRIEYLRLLDYLPPLKPNSSAPGNFTITSSNMPGSPNAQLTRIPSHAGKQYELGRAYNPLQYIRNQRSRARDRRILDHAAVEFANVDRVREWVDLVQEQSMRHDYRRDDAVRLPRLQANQETAPQPVEPARPHKGWIFTSEELLADVHWLEQGENKMLAENRHGRRIFSPRETKQQDLIQSCTSREVTDKRRRSWADDPAGGHGTGDESDKASERGRKRKLLTVLRSDSPKGGGKHSRRGSRLRNKEDTDKSTSGSESGRRSSRLPGDSEQNTGPLALLLEQQAKYGKTNSPAISSTDLSETWGRDTVEKFINISPARRSLEVLRSGSANVHDPENFRAPTKSRKILTLSIDDTEPRSSLEDWDITLPNTPLHLKRFPHLGTDVSPPISHADSERKRPKRSKLNIFHSHQHDRNQRHEIQIGLVMADKHIRSHQTSEEMPEERSRGTSLIAAPGVVRNLLTHRKNESVSSLASPDKMRRRETVEPHSAVTRFFKGAKHGGSKVGEFIFRRDRADDSDAETQSDRESLDFDTDVSIKRRGDKRLSIDHDTTAGTTKNMPAEKNDRNHLDLPSFRRVKNRRSKSEIASDWEHHISQQTRERKNSRSPRIDKLLPPRMDLGTISGSSATASLGRIISHSQRSLNEMLPQHGGRYISHPPTAFSKLQAIDRRLHRKCRPTLDAKRHWSIANDDENIMRRQRNSNIVTQADITRVRALFLCSGIKAKEIDHRAQKKRFTPPKFLREAAASTRTQLISVPIREEHVLAARIIVKDLEVWTRSLQSSFESFRDMAIKELTSHIADLHSTVDSDLVTCILNSSDQALHITSEISGQGPLHVKQITDEIDRLLRTRRRQMRWVRRFGWMLVEWALVALMWCLWLVVVLIRSLNRVSGLGWAIMRWLLWL